MNRPLVSRTLFAGLAIVFTFGFTFAFVAALLLATSQFTSEAATNADPVRGKLLFAKRCAGCHDLDVDGEGPHLRNVYGRKAGNVPAFQYSDALRSANITWDDASLEQWLTNPSTLVPNTEMDFYVPKAEERADIIRFLRVSSGK
jgi:cytochrome c